MKYTPHLLLLLLIGFVSNAQVGINTTNPQAVLDVDSQENGILIPRVTLTAANIAAPVVNPAGGTLEESTLVYNTATSGTGDNEVTPGYYYWDGDRWVRFKADKEDQIKYYTVTGTIDVVTQSNSFAPIAEMQLNITSESEVVLVQFSAAGRSFHTEQRAEFELRRNGIPVKIFHAPTENGVNPIGPIWDISFFYPLVVTPREEQIIQIFWRGTTQLRNQPTTNVFDHRVLSVIDPVKSYGVAAGNTTSVTPDFWSVDGNFATNSAIHFLGTTDNQDLVFRRNNIRSGFIGDTNIAFGTEALFNSTGEDNSAYGAYALRSNTLGARNVAVGVSALRTNTIGTDNTSVGYNALRNNRGINNTAVGSGALNLNVTGEDNTATGSGALYSNRGNWNTAHGKEALTNNTTGTGNAGFGIVALLNNTIGENNTALGGWALRNNDTGNNNTAAGNSALRNNISGLANVAVGMEALFINTEGNANTALGRAALYSNLIGNDNTAVGYHALFNNVNGSYNTALGRQAFQNGTYSNSTALGYNAQITTSNRVRIGNTNVNWIGGQVGWTNASDSRIKNNVTENVPGLSFITKLKPVTYHFDIRKQNEIMGIKDDSNYPEKYDIEKIKFSGFLAQDVEKAAQQIGYDFSGVTAPKRNNDIYSLRYAEFVVPLVKAVQELKTENDELKEAIRQLLQRVEVLENK